MQIGDLLFVRGDSFADEAIRLGEKLLDGTPMKKNYSHVAILLSPTRIAEAQWGRVTGTQLVSYYTSAHPCEWGETRFTLAQRAAIAKRAVELFGRPYNVLEIGEIGVKALTGINIPHADTEHRFICSEYVRDVIRDATGTVLSPKVYCTPEDLALSHYVTLHKVD